MSLFVIELKAYTYIIDNNIVMSKTRQLLSWFHTERFLVEQFLIAHNWLAVFVSIYSNKITAK